MPKQGKRTLSKSVLSQVLRYECDRLLRFRLATSDEKTDSGIETQKYKRPAIELIQSQGGKWETDKYHDFIYAAGAGNVVYQEGTTVDPFLGFRRFETVDLFTALRRVSPPIGIIEGEFKIPNDITMMLKALYEEYGLEPVRARPDILWIRRAPTGAPLLGPKRTPEFEIHIVDVKLQAEPTISHFAEVTFYALALARAIETEGLAARYGVSAQGYIWPGTHEINAFRDLFHRLRAQGSAEPLAEALLETLHPVPYEVYQVHVRQFFDEWVPSVLRQDLLDTMWHVAPKCQYCDYVRYCGSKAKELDHLSRIPWLNLGNAELLRGHGITTCSQLADAIVRKSTAWEQAAAESPQLRADEGVLLVRALALETGTLQVMEGRRCGSMPRYVGMRIYVNINFDPGSGITFALGARRVYFRPDGAKGSVPDVEEKVYVVDRMEDLDPKTERRRLLEFLGQIRAWLQEADDYNRQLPDKERKANGVSAHLFFWDGIELKQLKRMLMRHREDAEALGEIELFLRIFPAEDTLPDLDLFRSQPITVVKDVVKQLFGLPLEFTYTLLGVANKFYPRLRQDGTEYEYHLRYGFRTEMNDQIPFERAYELWTDNILLKHWDTKKQYTRDEIYEGIKAAVSTRLDALAHVVRRIGEKHGDLLVMKKSPFSIGPSSQPQVPDEGRQLIVFEKLNKFSEQIENLHQRMLPVDEREARFISIRGLVQSEDEQHNAVLRKVLSARPSLAERVPFVCIFSPVSRDARIKDNDFLVVLTNEDAEVDVDSRWYHEMGIDWQTAHAWLEDDGIDANRNLRKPLKNFLQVEIVALAPLASPPHIVLAPVNPTLFQFALSRGMLGLDRPMVLDPIFRDYSSEEVEQAVRVVGGKYVTRRRAR